MMQADGTFDHLAQSVLSVLAFLTDAKADPAPGDVFREYVWKPGGNYHVLNAKQSPIPVAQQLDLVAATKP